MTDTKTLTKNTAADKAEGIRLALASAFEFPPGQGFHYSDINFIILGHLIEKITGGLLVLTGIAFLTGGIERLSFWLIETFPILSTLG